MNHSRLVQVLLIIVITAFTGSFYITERGPEWDEKLYLNYSYTLYKYDMFGLTKQPGTNPEASARVAPLLPLFIASLMHVDRALAQNVECSVIKTNVPQCNNDFSTIKYAELLLLSICIGIIWLLLCKISKSTGLSYITIILILLSSAPYYYTDHFLTESVYLPIACIFTLCYSIALIDGDKWYMLSASVLLAILALTRPSFYYLFFILFIFTLIYIYMYMKDMHVSQKPLLALCFLIPFLLTISPWLYRNYQHFNKPALTIGYGAQALSSRLSYNRMTNAEYLYGWVYWLPDFGDSLAIKLFGNKNVRRLDFSDPKGFILHERKLIRDEVSQVTGIDIRGHATGDNISPEKWLIDKYIWNDLLTHIKVTMLLAWRAIFIEKYFGLLGFLFMTWGLVTGLRKYTGFHYYLISLPPVMLVFFHAFLTVSIPRYNILLLLPMSIAMAAGLIELYHWLKRKISGFAMNKKS